MRSPHRAGLPRLQACVAVLGLLLGGAAPGRLAAQDPGVRADLDRLWQTLASVSAPARLRSLEKSAGGNADGPADQAMRYLRRGLIRLRLGETGDGWSFGRAADDFGDATELEPGWAYAWYARGVAHLAEARWQAANPLNLGERVGFGSLEDAVADFDRSLAIDPTSVVALRQLYTTAVLLRDTTRWRTVVLPAFRTAVAAGADQAEVHYARGRTERLVGDPALAVAAFRAYLAAGGSPGLGLRELAWSGFAAGDSVADSAYYAGARYDDSTAVAAYREDLALIADSTELAGFDSTRGDDRVAFLRRWWTDKDRQALRAPGERLAEHYRRLSHAERYYGLEINRRYYSGTDFYHSGSDRFDDRGIVYIRYGEPDDRVSTITYNIQPNETWRYRRADGDLLLHFAANVGGDLHDLRLIPSVMDIGGVGGLGDDTVLPIVLKQRCYLFEPYCKLQAWGHYGQIKLLNREADVVQASTFVAVTSDGDDPRFGHALDASAALFAVGRAHGWPLLHLAFEIRVQVPDSVAWGNRLLLPVGVRLDLFDRAGRSAGWLDTTAVLTLPASGPGVTSGMGRVVLSAPPGNWRYRASLRYGDSTGLVLRTDSVSIEPFDGSRLVLSDLVLAPVRRGALWIPAPGDSAWFSPQTTWSRQDTIAVYHELYGLAAGDPYQAKLAVRRGRHTELTLSWEGRASGPVTRVTRTLSVESLKRGDYLLELTITDAARRQTRRSRRFSVR